VAKRLPQNPGSNHERKLNALRTELRSYLLPTIVPTNAVIREIERFLVQWRNKPSISRLVANQLAKHLVSQWPFASTKSVEPLIEAEIRALLTQGDISPAVAKHMAERLTTKWRFASIDAIDRVIENRPELLDQTVIASARDEVERLIKMLPNLPRPKQRRKKPSSDQERSQRIAKSKKRYDRHRTYKATGVGLIEREFGEHRLSLSNPFPADPPSGPCLDSLLAGGGVKMSRDLYSMEDLFGFDRHKFPKSIICVRRGRSVFYDLRGLMQCMVAFLGEKRPERNWLPEPVRRQRVLTGVIKRAQDVASEEVAEFVRRKLQPCLT